MFLVDKYKSTEKRGREIKKIYIPDNRCVIEEKADMGNLIFLKSIYTGLWFIILMRQMSLVCAVKANYTAEIINKLLNHLYYFLFFMCLINLCLFLTCLSVNLLILDSNGFSDFLKIIFNWILSSFNADLKEFSRYFL